MPGGGFSPHVLFPPQRSPGTILAKYSTTPILLSQGQGETALLDVALDPEVSVQWSIVIIGEPQDAPGVLLRPNLALGRAYIGGGGTGVGRPIPFDLPDGTLILSVPAGSVKVTADASPIRFAPFVPGVVPGGRFSAYLIPHTSDRRSDVYLTVVSGPVAAGATAIVGPGLFSPIGPVGADAVKVFQGAPGAVAPSFPAVGPYRYQTGDLTFGWAGVAYGGIAGSPPPDWLPIGAQGWSVAIQNNAAFAQEFTAIYRMRL